MTTKDTAEYELVTDMIMTMMGVNRMAYIKPIRQADRAIYTVFAADGTALAEFECQEEAFRSIQEHELTPVRLH
ncbi:MAG: DUF1150 domain-containing protein [Rickettsiales bacterium]|nr:DUF1150 domain-containing protein [Rickettsiales bacterium]